MINHIVRNCPMGFKGVFTCGFLAFFLLLPVFAFSQTAEDEKNYQQCKACHTLGGGPLVGPDLKGITDIRDEAWLIDFIQNSQEMIQAGDELAVKVFNENSNIPMPSHNLTDEQVKGMLLYMANDGKLAAGEAAAAGETQNVESEVAKDTAHLIVEMRRDEQQNMKWIFIVMAILFVICVFDLAVLKILKVRWIHYIVMLVALAVIGEIVFVEAAALGRQQYYQPDQPVWFSHEVHSGQNQIDCEYCHFTANKSMYAGIPPVETCMNCHNQVKEGKQTGTLEIAKIFDAFEKNRPIEWVKVYNLPDHVYFNHAQHVNIGKMECEDCHGEVEKMDRIIQESDLSMGWCVDCHRAETVQFASNKFYDQYTELHKKIKNGKIQDVTVQNVGGDECAKCHY